MLYHEGSGKDSSKMGQKQVNLRGLEL